LYLNSGGIPEYCDGFGVSFNNLQELEKKLEEIISKKDYFQSKLTNYPFDSKNMNMEYLNLFQTLVNEKLLNKQDNKLYFKWIYLFRFKVTKLSRKFSKANLIYLIRKMQTK